MFQSPIDICNRGLQHCGAPRIDLGLGFTEVSPSSTECFSVYDKLRRAELRRNVWRFSIRNTVLRPIDTTTMFLKASLWSSTSTYYRGSIVSDQTGVLWMSNSPDNVGNVPGNSAQWDFYFGPLAVDPWDNTGGTAYFAGELVYNAPGDGTFKVFMSLQSSNTDNPLVPTQWSATTTYAKDQIAQFSPAWSSLTTYSAGQTVTYTDGNTYASLAGSNLNNVPTLASKWALAPTQTSSTLAPAMLEWVSTTAYSIGQFVDVNGTQYVALGTSTNAPPATSSSSWAALTLGVLYASMIDANTNNEPDLAPAAWAVGTTYAANAKVCGSDGVIYQSIGNGNVGNNPISDGGAHWTNTGVLCPWTTANLSGSGSLKWLKLQSPAMAEANILYPIGSGPTSQASTKNVFRLPANFLRKAPQDPKVGSYSPLGAPSNDFYDDWNFQGNFLTSRMSQPIVLRFVADIADVLQMDDMFCEGLGARIGLEVCETLTQSTAKKQTIASEYQRFMGEARMVNGIETGAEEPALDDYLACRI